MPNEDIVQCESCGIELWFHKGGKKLCEDCYKEMLANLANASETFYAVLIVTQADGDTFTQWYHKTFDDHFTIDPEFTVDCIFLTFGEAEALLEKERWDYGIRKIVTFTTRQLVELEIIESDSI